MSTEAMSWFYLYLVERNQRHNNFCSFKKISLSRMFWKKAKKLTFMWLPNDPKITGGTTWLNSIMGDFDKFLTENRLLDNAIMRRKVENNALWQKQFRWGYSFERNI